MKESALEIYSKNIPHSPSLLEIRNQYHSFVFFLLVSYLYVQHGQYCWTVLTNNWDLDSLGFTATFILISLVYWLWSLFFYLLDRRPDLFNQYRVQNFRMVRLNDYGKALKTGLFNSLVVSGLFGYLSHIFYKHRTRDIDLRILPSVYEIARDHLMFLIVLYITFYYSHRLLHQPWFYQRIHKKHHEFIAPIAMAAIYAHPIEHIISNLTPLFLGPMLMKSHIVTYWIWLMITVTGTMINHSGYCLPGLGSPVNHDFHHYVQQENYGVFGLIDHIHHTDSQYLSMVQLILNRKKYAI